MAFTEAERVKIRRYLGYSVVFNNSEPRLESAITTVEAYDDTVTEARAHLAALATIETRLASLWDIKEAGKAEEVEVDALRGAAGLRREGRRFVGLLADIFDTAPARDVFSPRSR